MTKSLTVLTIPERFRAAASTFSDRVAGTRDWDVPTPVAEWRARDVVGHLTEWLPGLLGAGSTVALKPVRSASEDPVRAWEDTRSQVQSLLDDPTTEDVVFEHPHIGRLSVPAMIDQYYTSDVVFHTWDLARATGQDDRLDATYLEGALAGMTAMREVIRSSGQFGQEQPVAEDADVQDRFFAFIGRDPLWTPPAPVR